MKLDDHSHQNKPFTYFYMSKIKFWCWIDSLLQEENKIDYRLKQTMKRKKRLMILNFKKFLDFNEFENAQFKNITF